MDVELSNHLLGMGCTAKDRPEPDLFEDFNQFDLHLIDHPERSGEKALVGGAEVLRERWPDAEFWNEETSIERIGDAAADWITDPDYTFYYLGRWAYGGNDEDLLELVRRARHRDGSTASIVCGTQAAGILAAGIEWLPDVAAALERVGKFREKLVVGDFPTTSSLAMSGAGRPTQSDPASPAATVPAGTVPDTSPATAIVAGASSGGELAASVGAGVTVAQENGKIFHQGVCFSIAEAISLETALHAAVLRLTRPAEGYLWDDAFDGSAFALICLDALLGDGLPLTPQGYLQGTVKPIQGSGQYAGVFQTSSGSQNCGPFDDVQQAKFELCKMARQSLTAAGKLK